MSSKKIHLQQFDIIHLSNSDLTYIGNPERETELCCPFISWKLTSRTLLCYLFLFSPSHRERNVDGNRSRDARICAWRGLRCQVAIDAKLFCQTV
jgi:hypothetical protein